MVKFDETPLYSKRLVYRLAKDEDYHDLVRIISNRRLTEPMGYSPILHEANQRAWFQYFKTKRNGFVIIYDDHIIGYCRVFEMYGIPALKEYETLSIGFCFEEAYQGQGFGKELVQFFTEYLIGKSDYLLIDMQETNTRCEKLAIDCHYTYLDDYTINIPELSKEPINCHSYYYDLRKKD